MDCYIALIVTAAYVLLSQKKDQFFYMIFFVSIGMNYRKVILLFKEKGIIRTLLRVIILYLLAYFLIKDPNPFYHLLFFYLPVQNYFRGLFILVFLSYLLSSQESKDYFFSTIFDNLTIRKSIASIVAMSLFSFVIYLHDHKFFIYLMNKHTTLNNHKFYIVTNLFNVEDILPDWISEMKKLIDYIGPENVYFSAFENGDSTDNTPKMLLEFGSYLDQIHVPNKIRIDKVVNKNAFERIQFLAQLRNRALDFLYEIPSYDYNNTKILFFNDIIFNYEDIIKLIMTNNHNYDVVCAMDYYESFYDTWATFGLDFEYPRHYFPYFVNKEAQDLFINGDPIRTFSCWNGVVVMNSLPFQNKGVVFRAGIAIRQSECLLVIRDMHSLGYNRIMINPQVKVTYEYYYYYMNKLVYPWTKNLFTYFYYYFRYIHIRRIKTLANVNDKNIQMDHRYNYLMNYIFAKSLSNRDLQRIKAQYANN